MFTRTHETQSTTNLAGTSNQATTPKEEKKESAAQPSVSSTIAAFEALKQPPTRSPAAVTPHTPSASFALTSGASNKQPLGQSTATSASTTTGAKAGPPPIKPKPQGLTVKTSSLAGHSGNARTSSKNEGEAPARNEEESNATVSGPSVSNRNDLPASFRLAKASTANVQSASTSSSSTSAPTEVSSVAPTHAIGPTSATSNVGAAASVASAHHDDRTPAEIQHAFKTSGLLIRTLQMKNAHHEFHNCNVSIDAAREQAKTGGHGGLRKWSLAHAELEPQYYKMGANVSTMARPCAVLAMPDLVGNHVVGVYDKDHSSGGITDTMKPLTPDDRKKQIGGLLGTLKSNQAQHGSLENSEIQTVGIAPGSIAALMFDPMSGQAGRTTWQNSKPKFEEMLSKAGPEFHGRNFPVFTFASKGGRTELTHIDTLRASPPPAASGPSTD
jgi:hypothetical protein